MHSAAEAFPNVTLQAPSEPGAYWQATSSDGEVVMAKTRDAALYYAGWWAGRRELCAAVETHARSGGRLDAACLQLDEVEHDIDA